MSFVKYVIGLGSDKFIFAPRSVDSVISKNLRGHRGIIEHGIVSDDLAYHELKIRGIQANVLDNDGDRGYISVADQTKGYHLMSEDGFGDFSFKLFPTRLPNASVTVSPSHLLLTFFLFGISLIIRFPFTLYA